MPSGERESVAPPSVGDPTPKPPRRETPTTSSMSQEDFRDGSSVPVAAMCVFVQHRQCFGIRTATLAEQGRYAVCPCCQVATHIEAQAHPTWSRVSRRLATLWAVANALVKRCIGRSVPCPAHLADIHGSGSDHIATQLPDDRLSVVIDPGSWANLMGERLAWAIANKAIVVGLQLGKTGEDGQPAPHPGCWETASVR